MIDTVSLEDTACFQHEAMNTVFSIYVPKTQDPERVEGAAAEAFDKLDTLEGLLSRYRPDSEISMINAMRAGERLLVTPDTHDCLRLAFEIYAETGGLFDVTLGEAIEHRKSQSDGLPPISTGQLRLVSSPPAVECVEAGRVVDLGGVGKGYALEKIAEVLRSWEVDSALLCSGPSTVLAIGPDAWPVEISGTQKCLRLTLQEQSLASSGTAVQGAHIVNPDALDNRKAYSAERVWVLSRSAARADAYSTVCLLLSNEETAELLKNASDIEQIYREESDGLIHLMRA
ncbi:MAG: FAD:protein FMN transferase [Planctomycetota bacterium]